MKMLKLSAALLGVASLPATAHSAYLTGNTLHNDLVAWSNVAENRAVGDDVSNGMQGVSYIIGVADALSGTTICVTNQNSAGQLTAVVRKYLDDHPDRWQFTASSLVQDALQQAFPCTKN